MQSETYGTLRRPVPPLVNWTKCTRR